MARRWSAYAGCGIPTSPNGERLLSHPMAAQSPVLVAWFQHLVPVPLGTVRTSTSQ